MEIRYGDRVRALYDDSIITPNGIKQYIYAGAVYRVAKVNGRGVYLYISKRTAREIIGPFLRQYFGAPGTLLPQDEQEPPSEESKAELEADVKETTESLLRVYRAMS